MTSKTLVAVIMNSPSDLPVMKETAEILTEIDVPHEIRILSVHRAPQSVLSFVEDAEDRGVQVIVAGSGGAAHLAGVVASHTVLPVIGVPLETTSLSGLDALYSTVQMPSGIPVGTMALGKVGARNAAIMAASILGLCHRHIQDGLRAYKKALEKKMNKEDRKLQTLGFQTYLKTQRG